MDFRFTPIDHHAIINWRISTNELSLLTKNESLISTPMFNKLFLKKEISDRPRNTYILANTPYFG